MWDHGPGAFPITRKPEPALRVAENFRAEQIETSIYPVAVLIRKHRHLDTAVFSTSPKHLPSFSPLARKRLAGTRRSSCGSLRPRQRRRFPQPNGDFWGGSNRISTTHARREPRPQARPKYDYSGLGNFKARDPRP